jgi:hypothetical protein
VARIPGLDVLAGETIALVGAGADAVLDALATALDQCAWVDGAAAAEAGTLRVHAQQAARVGLTALAVTGPLGDLDPAARALAVADLAGLRSLGVTTVVVLDDLGVAALVADRVAVVRDAEVTVTYPVLAPVPRVPADVSAVAERIAARLAPAGG